MHASAVPLNKISENFLKENWDHMGRALGYNKRKKMGARTLDKRSINNLIFEGVWVAGEGGGDAGGNQASV